MTVQERRLVRNRKNSSAARTQGKVSAILYFLAWHGFAGTNARLAQRLLRRGYDLRRATAEVVSQIVSH